jgi:8-oxo-dGTP pyrophosphatase MutT (NUDIX family)
MPAAIDPEVMNVDELPGVWSPVQWDLSPEERVKEVEEQATASLLFAVDIPEAILRLLLQETGIERAYEPPKGYDPTQQGDWEDDLITFRFKRPLQLVHFDRESDHLSVEYDFNNLGRWAVDITPDRFTFTKK